MTILVAYVPTPSGEAAFAFAMAEATARAEDVLAFHASRGDRLASDRALENEDTARLQAEAQRLGVTLHVETALGVHSLSEQILAAADRVSARLIVIGSRGRSAVGKILMGSTALEILTHAHRPVVTVKAERG